eukprot:TRINITY_DN12139_c0_g1_i2.p1 TRINITY_DN12139_c0_g1~~TRINITY_DN12139_c0_g1_i2.p1  ORF type:complete len:750 (-),score=120.73 TRINITY_DN12139_c0_g1_i2:276-2525(-)
MCLLHSVRGVFVFQVVLCLVQSLHSVQNMARAWLPPDVNAAEAPIAQKMARLEEQLRRIQQPATFSGLPASAVRPIQPLIPRGHAAPDVGLATSWLAVPTPGSCGSSATAVATGSFSPAHAHPVHPGHVTGSVSRLVAPKRQFVHGGGQTPSTATVSFAESGGLPRGSSHVVPVGSLDGALQPGKGPRRTLSSPGCLRSQSVPVIHDGRPAAPSAPRVRSGSPSRSVSLPLSASQVVQYSASPGTGVHEPVGLLQHPAATARSRSASTSPEPLFKGHFTNGPSRQRIDVRVSHDGIALPPAPFETSDGLAAEVRRLKKMEAWLGFGAPGAQSARCGPPALGSKDFLTSLRQERRRVFSFGGSAEADVPEQRPNGLHVDRSSRLYNGAAKSDSSSRTECGADAGLDETMRSELFDEKGVVSSSQKLVDELRRELHERDAELSELRETCQADRQAALTGLEARQEAIIACESLEEANLSEANAFSLECQHARVMRQEVAEQLQESAKLRKETAEARQKAVMEVRAVRLEVAETLHQQQKLCNEMMEAETAQRTASQTCLGSCSNGRGPASKPQSPMSVLEALGLPVELEIAGGRLDRTERSRLNSAIRTLKGLVDRLSDDGCVAPPPDRTRPAASKGDELPPPTPGETLAAAVKQSGAGEELVSVEVPQLSEEEWQAYLNGAYSAEVDAAVVQTIDAADSMHNRPTMQAGFRMPSIPEDGEEVESEEPSTVADVQSPPCSPSPKHEISETG